MQSHQRPRILVLGGGFGGLWTVRALKRVDAEISFAVRDNGSGGASMDDGSGLRGLADRIEALGGRLDVESPCGAGTVVRATLPLRP